MAQLTLLEMNQNDQIIAIKYFLLHERGITARYKQASGLNKTAIEVLAFGDSRDGFTIYQALKHFKESNVQTIRRGVRLLTSLRYIELIGYNGKSNAAVFTLTKSGARVYQEYLKLFL